MEIYELLDIGKIKELQAIFTDMIYMEIRILIQ